jgi:outer membrane biogenesis lipoprotein LolB
MPVLSARCHPAFVTRVLVAIAAVALLAGCGASKPDACATNAQWQPDIEISVDGR